MRDDGERSGPAHLRPQGGFHILAEWRDWIAVQAIDAAADALDVSVSGQLNELDRSDASAAGLGGCEIAKLRLR
jgi:hypothetical protein